MGKNGAVLLGELAARATHIDIECSRCDRKGRYRLAKLVARLGEEFPMTDLGAELADCPRRTAATHHERCDVFFPGLPKIMAEEQVSARTSGEKD
ncbi:hypothetical protein [Caballeronia zhejiangensis]|uniref:Uncharacterized protein n=1 Tax=Caballeronia zhejiangensis TaxID=871203 RepID=A0A656QBL2_9BURK|nr:hypothetical protein [Caballeronia zhejiangensis]KDR25415.1 hypothetical protein BG60_28125 [Caballeronia zhejiangensis]